MTSAEAPVTATPVTERRCGVVGDPIAHSLSPALHNAGYAALGLDGFRYDAAQVAAGTLADHLAGLDATWQGLSVTAPLKREALQLATEATERAVLAGGANTLVRRPSAAGGGWRADNTDLPGAIAAIRERYDGPLAAAVILGAGATAASVGLALATLGAGRVTIAARNTERAAATVRTIAAHPDGPQVDVVDLASYPPAGRVVEADIVVSTVPAAAQTEDLVARFVAVPVLFDVVYDPWPTPLAAAHRGPVVTGLDLLVHQACAQFEQFTGRPGPLAAMRAAGEVVLASRQHASAAEQRERRLG